MGTAKLLVLALAALAVLVLVAQNAEVVTLRFLVWEWTVSRIVLLPLLFGAGFLLGLFLAARPQRG